MAMFEILQLNQYNHVPTNIEHPMSLSLHDQMKLEEEGKSFTLAAAKPGLTAQVISELEMSNKQKQRKICRLRLILL